jgi:hypothetical protein
MRKPAARSAVIAAEPLERRRMLAVQVIAPIAPVAMSIGSAATPVVIRLADHFKGDAGGLTYRVSSRFGYVGDTIDARGDMTLRASATVPAAFVTALDQVTIRATSKTNSADFRELSFDVIQRAPVRIGNALTATAGGALVASATELDSGTVKASLVAAAAVPRPPVTGTLDSRFGDFNGDFADDVAWLDARGRIWVSPATGQTEFRGVSEWGALPAGQRWQTITVGDFDSDGRSDIAARNARTGAWWVALSTGSGFTAARVFGAWSRSVPWDNIVVADFDGNGTSDIAGRNPWTGQFFVSSSDGGRFTTTSSARLNPGLFRSLSEADFNGDGRADFASRNIASGAWTVVLSEGARFGRPQVFGGWSKTVAWNTITLGDFDRDGRADIAARNPRTGDWIVSRSTGRSFVTAPFGGFGRPVKGETIVAGDFNNDGKTDIASRDPRSGVWRMLASAGTRFAAPVTIGTGAAAWTNIRPLRIGYRQTTSGSSSSSSVATGSINVNGWSNAANTGGVVLTTGTGLLGVGGWSNFPTGTIAGGSVTGTNAFTGSLPKPDTTQGTGTLQVTGTSNVIASIGSSIATNPIRVELGTEFTGTLKTSSGTVSTASGDVAVPPGELTVKTTQSPLSSNTLSGSGTLTTPSGVVTITSGTLSGETVKITAGTLTTSSGTTPILSGRIPIASGALIGPGGGMSFGGFPGTLQNQLVTVVPTGLQVTTAAS